MRMPRPQMFMEIALVVAKRSVCHRLNVGAILVQENNIISIGYNGPASGKPHCSQCEVITTGGCSRSIHAEFNALQKIKDLYQGAPISLYVTHSPCSRCTDLIIESGRISEVYFQAKYRDDSHLHKLLSAGIELLQCAPNGMITRFGRT